MCLHRTLCATALFNHPSRIGYILVSVKQFFYSFMHAWYVCVHTHVPHCAHRAQTFSPVGGSEYQPQVIRFSQQDLLLTEPSCQPFSVPMSLNNQSLKKSLDYVNPNKFQYVLDIQKSNQYQKNQQKLEIHIKEFDF